MKQVLLSMALAAGMLGACETLPAAPGIATAQEPTIPAPEVAAQRVIILTDMLADPDDEQSLVRLLLYANEIDIVGLVATTSTWKRTNPAPEFIRKILAAYGEVHENLLVHDPSYPAASTLQAVVATGVEVYGMAGVGTGKDTEGSDLIIRELEKDDPRPLWISVWGGSNTLAQALFTLRETKSPEELDRLVARLRVYTISDQDDSGPWMRREFPELFYIVSPGGEYEKATWLAMSSVIGNIDNTTISNDWLAENIQQGHGPLGALYPDVAWGMEGDTPAYLSLIPNGLNVPDRPDWGGWGGRYELYTPNAPEKPIGEIINGIPVSAETRPIWTNAEDSFAPPLRPEFGRPIRMNPETTRDFRVTLWRWRDHFQNDFAARMDWTVKPFDEANHPPVVKLDHPPALTVKSGQGVNLSAAASYDPDGDSLQFFWFHYPEPGGNSAAILAGAEVSRSIWVNMPQVSEPETFHFILQVTDRGEPPLTRYARVVVTVEP